MLSIGSLLPGIDLIVALAIAGSLAGFSREQELAADSYAIQMMVENNFRRDAGQEVMQLFDDLSQFLRLPKHTFLASHPNSTARYDNSQANLANHPVSVVNEFSFARINYDSLVANSRAKVGKILLQQKQYDFLDYFLQHYAHVGWEAQSVLLKAELIYGTAKDSSRVLPSVIAALRAVKNPEVHVEYFRILGLTYFKEQEWRQGKENLERYLALKKSAKDRLYIEGLIKRCEENER
jgi:predicted Zn-dependent protease